MSSVTANYPHLVFGDAMVELQKMDAGIIDAFVDDPPAGISFMSRGWDSLSKYEPRTERGHEVHQGLDLLGLERWASGFTAFMFEVSAAKLRLAKPGAHSLSWALPRTSDLTMLAMRLAGWEIRDVVTHLFGGGFPKSHDVGKALDKRAGAGRDVIGQQAQSGNGGCYSASSLALGTAVDGRVLDGRSAENKAAYRARESFDLTAPATALAEQWDGWGTALSPGAEFWVLARAPLDGTVAGNVEAHGVGGVNIDGCRTGTTKDVPASAPRDRIGQPSKGDERGRTTTTPGFDPNVGRWPKNAVLTCAIDCEPGRHTPWCPVGDLDRQSGHQVSGTAIKRNIGAAGAGQQVDVKARTQRGEDVGFSDSGGASRFFPTFGYHAKASDRRVPGRPDLTNAHPTHKNPALMRWLIRLITPPGGVLLDTFMGSGTTGVAAIAEAVKFMGIERDPAHFEVARSRILAAVGSPEYAAEANEHAPKGSQLGLL